MKRHPKIKPQNRGALAETILLRITAAADRLVTRLYLQDSKGERGIYFDGSDRWPDISDLAGRIKEAYSFINKVSPKKGKSK